MNMGYLFDILNIINIQISQQTNPPNNPAFKFSERRDLIWKRENQQSRHNTKEETSEPPDNPEISGIRAKAECCKRKDRNLSTTNTVCF